MKVIYSENAAALLKELSKREGCGDQVVDEIAKTLEMLSDNPDLTSTPSFPHHPNRGRLYYCPFTIGGVVWRMSLLVEYVEDAMRVLYVAAAIDRSAS